METFDTATFSLKKKSHLLKEKIIKPIVDMFLNTQHLHFSQFM